MGQVTNLDRRALVVPAWTLYSAYHSFRRGFHDLKTDLLIQG